MSSFNTVVDALQHWGKHSNNRPAFIFLDHKGGRQVFTWEILYSLARRWAAHLHEDGIGKGQFVVNALPNSPERVVSEAAILFSGAATVNGQCQLDDGSDLLSILRQSRATALLINPDTHKSAWDALQEHVHTITGSLVTSKELPNLCRSYLIRRTADDNFLKNLESSMDSFLAKDVKAGDVCTVFTKSGTSGIFKLVAFTHGDLVNILADYNMLIASNRCAAKEFNMAPLGLIGGYAGQVFLRGGIRVLCDVTRGKPDDVADFMWRAIQAEKCDTAVIPPLYLLQILNRVQELKNERQSRCDWLIDTVVLEGQPVTSSMVKAIGVICHSVAISYGSTEFGLAATQRLTGNTTFEDYDAGLPLKNVQVKIVSERDKILQPAEMIGNILVKSSCMLKDYLNDPKATSAALTEDGFFRSGDVGKITSEGHLIVLGPRQNIILRGADILYSGWLESRIRACLNITDVMIVGVPDALLKEEVCACLVISTNDITVDDVREFIDKDILSYGDTLLSLNPRYYLKFEDFPLTSSGQPNRSEIKRLASMRYQTAVQRIP